MANEQVNEFRENEYVIIWTKQEYNYYGQNQLLPIPILYLYVSLNFIFWQGVVVESIEAAAIREAKEETGCDLRDIKFLCSQNPANGMSDALVHCFAAKVQSENNILDTDEIGSKKWFSKKEYMELLKSNGTKDGVSILAILFALQFYPFGRKC